MDAETSTRELERELVARLRAGDERAFDLFAESYLPGLLRFARRRLPSHPELARDVAQATACAVIERLGSFRGESSLRTWIFACCSNEIAAHFRRAGRRPQEVEIDDEDAWEETDSGPEAELLRLERVELVHAALECLPPLQARAMEWRYVDGLGVDEVARRLDATYKAAESMLARGRSAFRRAYARLAGVPAESKRTGAAGDGRPRSAAALQEGRP